ncbi:hypothetical protein HBB16_12560 [Pseudonocardia sp. MCCB 268]|nr:hypothetical protein [Pseudonocardia cytotoxica]
MVDGVALLTAKIQGLWAAGRYDDEPGDQLPDSGAPFYDTSTGAPTAVTWPSARSSRASTRSSSAGSAPTPRTGPAGRPVTLAWSCCRILTRSPPAPATSGRRSRGHRRLRDPPC